MAKLIELAASTLEKCDDVVNIPPGKVSCKFSVRKHGVRINIISLLINNIVMVYDRDFFSFLHFLCDNYNGNT